MANWLLCVEPDAVQREAIKARVRSGIAPVPTLTVRSLDFPGGFLVWAQGPDVVETCQTDPGTA